MSSAFYNVRIMETRDKDYVDFEPWRFSSFESLFAYLENNIKRGATKIEIEVKSE